VAGARSNEFMLYYQPIIDLETGVIVGAEALLRWPEYSRHLDSPADFIRCCERCASLPR